MVQARQAQTSWSCWPHSGLGLWPGTDTRRQRSTSSPVWDRCLPPGQRGAGARPAGTAPCSRRGEPLASRRLRAARQPWAGARCLLLLHGRLPRPAPPCVSTCSERRRGAPPNVCRFAWLSTSLWRTRTPTDVPAALAPHPSVQRRDEGKGTVQPRPGRGWPRPGHSSSCPHNHACTRNPGPPPSAHCPPAHTTSERASQPLSLRPQAGPPR